MAEESHIRIVEQRAADAEENRIQTERFLDMVSVSLEIQCCLRRRLTIFSLMIFPPSRAVTVRLSQFLSETSIT